eukprot:5963692-Pleurochrysis_carterae.AAC.1
MAVPLANSSGRIQCLKCSDKRETVLLSPLAATTNSPGPFGKAGRSNLPASAAALFVLLARVARARIIRLDLWRRLGRRPAALHERLKILPTGFFMQREGMVRRVGAQHLR